MAWGYNDPGQLGDGTTTNRYTPVQVLDLTGVVAIAGGGAHSLFLAEPTIPADLNADGDVDGQDFAIFLAAFGYSQGQPQFNPACDYDADGRVTLADYQVWFGYYTAFVGNPAAPVPVGARGDFDADGDVDVADFAVLQSCIPTPPERAFPCVAKFDYNADQRVDLSDFAEFTAGYAGPQGR